MASPASRDRAAKERARAAAKSLIKEGSGWDARRLATAVKEGQRDALAQAITWVESALPEHQERIEAVLNETSGDSSSLRIGFTGIPGAGKSTLIERFGLEAVERGHKVAVLAIDPSSQRTKGSLLGDKTRMLDLSKHPDASSDPLLRLRPWVASRGDMEAIQLCEAAGYDLILVETVGVGQSEVSVRSMVDVFVLMLIGGAGDDVQGIKRGVVEMADLVVVHKAEVDNLKACRATANAYRHALHVLPTPPSDASTEVLLVSSLTGEGHPELWEHIYRLQATWKASGWWNEQRTSQQIEAMHRHARQLLIESHMHHKSELWGELEAEVRKGKASPFASARRWIQSPNSRE